MKFFLVTTDHLLDRLWFRDDEDFRTAMNLVAVAVFLSGINILAFILMSNHVHFVLECERHDAKRFIDLFKRLYSHYYCRKYRCSEHLRKVRIQIDEVFLHDESLCRAIAYVQMNCVAANICSYPAAYPWGTGALFFNLTTPDTTPLGNMSGRSQIRLLHSNVHLPQDWRVLREGYLWPGSYVRIETVASVFNTPKRYNYFLNNSSKAKRRLDSDASPSFRDQVVVAGARDLCSSLFRTDSINALNTCQKAELVKQLKRRFCADINQICRVTGISYREVAEMLD